MRKMRLRNEKSEKARELLRLLATGEKEIATGEGYTLASVLKEADALLKDDDS